MKGILWKWTNYWMGWQPRWFILGEDGILSYYTSEEEVTQGCKGSVSLSACDINVHSSDNLRLDIVIPGEQHIYVRASSTLERQQWLVALGSAKAQGVQSGVRNPLETATPDAIKTKKSELRLYCDLLMQLAHSIKEVATAEGGPNVGKLDECTTLLSATCETFINTLDECVKISNSISPYLQPSPSSSLVVPAGTVSKVHLNGSAGVQGSKDQKFRSIAHSSSSEH